MGGTVRFGRRGDPDGEAPEIPQSGVAPAVVWSGHLMDYSGYAKANRELLFRVANSLAVSIFTEDLAAEPVIVDAYTQLRLQAHRRVRVAQGVPFLRFYTPKRETWKATRICFTMMETETVHKDFISLMNRYYHEVFTPTEWNKQAFIRSGLKVPCRVVPLGVDRNIYRRLGGDYRRPQATLLTTFRAGGVEVPGGYSFITLCQPTFRKGIDVVVAAFERAFADDPHMASLVLVTSVHQKLDAYGSAPFSKVRGGQERMKSRVYHLTGRWSEGEMARLYSGFDCYVTASRGEGWNLPMTEAAACGLQVIASKCSSHTELLDGTEAVLVEPDGYSPVRYSERICIWYEGQTFANYDDGAIDRFADAMRLAASGSPAKAPREPLLDRIARCTWDVGADIIVKRLLELQEGV